MTSPEPSRTADVLVVGMGDTGTLVATRLSRRHDVVGISTTPCFVSGQELGYRLARPDDWRRDYQHEWVSYRRLRGADVVHGEVESLDLDGRTASVRTAAGDQTVIAWRAVVLATGTTNGFWRTAEVRPRKLVDERVDAAAAAVADAGTVAVVGGGPSGVNVASQIADAHPDVVVSLHHSGTLPLPTYHPKVRADVVRRLERQGVARHPGRRAELPDDLATLGPGTVSFTTGQPDVTADLVVWTVGRVTPNTAFLPLEVLDDDGFVRVDRSLRVVGHEDVFAVGDVAATDPLRSSARNFAHRLVAANVQVVLTGRGRFRTYRAPRHRWGSILGLQSDGYRIHTARGLAVPLRPWFTRHVLFPVLTHRLLYGGIRRRP